MQLPFWKIVVLAVVQGITEFLPISSDGHLLVAAAIMSPDGSVKGMELNDLTIVLHLGTLFSILLFYRQRVWGLLREDRRTARMLILGTVPAVIVGLPMKLWGEQLILENTILAGIMLVFTGLLLIWAARQARGAREYQELTISETLLIGTSQAAAILPGLSRSGMTISAALKLGLTPRAAATFSFLLAIPAIAGAGVLEFLLMFIKKKPLITPASHLLAGAGISFAVGMVSLWLLVRMLERGRLQWFAAWSIPLGIGVIIWQLFT